LSRSYGDWCERLHPGCFRQAVERGSVLLFNHDRSKVLASTESGTLRLDDSAECLTLYADQDDSNAFHQQAVEAIEIGEATGVSFRFSALPGGDEWTPGGDGFDIREIREAVVKEFSIVSDPAFQKTSVKINDSKRSTSDMAKTIEDNKKMKEKVLRDQHKLLDAAEKEKRDLTPDEESTWKRLEAEFADLADEEKYLIRREKELEAEARARFASASARPPIKPMPQGQIQLTDDEKRLMAASQKGATKPMPETREEYRYDPNSSEPRHAFNRYLRDGAHALNEAEYRALQADIDTVGGYLVAPTEMANEIIAALDNAVYIRQLARTFKLETAESLGAPALDDDFGDPTWASELSSGSADNTMSLDKRQIFPHPIARRIKVSNKLLRMSTLAPETFVKERMTAVMGTVLENAYMNGTGQNQPLGLFTPSAMGINTDRDYTSESTTVKIDDLIGMVGTLKAQYRKNATWLISRPLETQLLKLKSGDGDYLLRKDLTVGPNQTMLGFPALVSEYVPSTFTTGKYIAILGDLKYYWIADALNMQIQRLVELYAETNQTGFIIRSESDAQPVLGTAFVRLRLK
jgi:HK97 family phage major capsid protein/HK97 family phage prohead protease